MDALKQKAADYKAVLLEGGFIEPRPEEQGGNGENFVLTPRGGRLLGLIGDETPKAAEARRLLEENGSEAPRAECFDRSVAGL